MKKLLFAVFLICSLSVFAQNDMGDKKKLFAKENAFIGGNGTFTVSGYGSVIGVNPMYGYFISKAVDVAAVMNLQYNSMDITSTNGGIIPNTFRKTTMVGVGVSSRVYPVDFLFIQAQPELNYLSGKEQALTGGQRKFSLIVPSLLVGAGMKRGFQRGKTFAYASILFDVMGNKNSPYRSYTSNPTGAAIAAITASSAIPIYRVGLNILLSDYKKNR